MDDTKTAVAGRPRVYLAGPDVFHRDVRRLGDRKKALCRGYGFEGVYPGDVEAGITRGTREEMGLSISKVNEDRIRTCQLVIAHITPFRGPSADVGTAYEMGFAHAIGLKVFAYSNVSSSFTERSVRLLGDSVRRDTHEQLRDNDDMAIEEFGFVDNLMLEGCIKLSEGELVVGNAPQDQLYTWLESFEECLRRARDSIWASQKSGIE